jgi:acyl CoA:acetate/3-ketoacid CoA transferase
MAPTWRAARRCERSAAACRCWSTRCTPTTRFVKAERGDRWGNLVYRKTARNFGPVMATAARITVATVHEVVELGEIDPESVVTPGVFVQRLVQIPRRDTALQGGGMSAPDRALAGALQGRRYPSEPAGRPKGEFRSAQHEGTVTRAP